ncbi:MAG: acyl-CoA dehydrogenase, partial [Chloroflexi bacterium]|nr:acyl-CoA dehydrogenase [Chloroflexota bacterium]
RVSIAAQCIGLARGAYEAGVAYSMQRRTFGSQLSDHQAVQFMLADMATEIDAARLLTHRAAWLVDKGLPHVKETAMAKLFASEAANRVVHRALQIHGGSGYFRPSKVERSYRDQRVTEIYEGTSEIQRLIIARSILKDGAA